ncbi:MAG: cobalt-precorrin-5B (C(1))-methyltransferase CbiD [Lachnospiraceae bacterium]|nr:cobalt-precorrin-5B (C(1))-methyltransferase CbiD [Lachnospiraceae bacterium]
MKKNKKLRCGYTTGSCAAAAAKAAAEMLLTGRVCRWADLMTPKGVPLHLPVLEQRISENEAVCAVRKYAGDDPDATDGILVYAAARRICGEEDKGALGEPCTAAAGMQTGGRVLLDGGIGVGRVTKPGLEQPVGAAAINRVPREMIIREAEAVCEAYEYSGRLKITISVPAGVEIAKKTFNPHIGIMGGISILGTSGIVVPMSEEALIASIRVEMRQKYENGEDYLLITPGNYGADFIRRRELSRALDAENSMKCSNYVGETLDMAAELGVKGILFVAHIGKFIKVSGGVMNTHSAHADCRAELIAAQAMRCGGAPGKRDAAEMMEIARRLLGTNTTEEAVGILKEENLLEGTMAEVLDRIHFHLQKRCQGAFETEVILFSNQYGYLGETEGAEEMMEKIIEQNDRLHAAQKMPEETEKG